jgi:hypothetical protein
MAFSYENVILPDRPMVLVHRDWQMTSRRSESSSTSPPPDPSQSRSNLQKGQSVFQASSESPPAMSVFKLGNSTESGATTRLETESTQKRSVKQSGNSKRPPRSKERPKNVSAEEKRKSQNRQVAKIQHPQRELSRYVPALSRFETPDLLEMNHYISYCKYSVQPCLKNNVTHSICRSKFGRRYPVSPISKSIV